MPKIALLGGVMIAGVFALALNRPATEAIQCEPSGKSVEALFAPSLTKECGHNRRVRPNEQHEDQNSH